MYARARTYLTTISDRDIIFVLLGFFAGAITVSFMSHLLSRTINLWAWLDNLAQNVGTEVFGAFLTFLIIEAVIEGRRRREKDARDEVHLKARLIREMGSQDSETALKSVQALRTHGWLGDRSLHRADLHEANLQGADLLGANLEGVDLNLANLQSANLNLANLQGASLNATDLRAARLTDANLSATFLVDANLQRADLTRANLNTASLFNADLQGANLFRARLVETNLTDANLQGARLAGVLFSLETILPDKTNWTHATDMDRFTDPRHRDFWRSTNPDSPAYSEDAGY